MNVTVCKLRGYRNSRGTIYLFIKLKTPDILNLGYVSPAANRSSNRWWAKICASISNWMAAKTLYQRAGDGGTRGWSSRTLVVYELRLEPWLKILTHTSDSKRFRIKTWWRSWMRYWMSTLASGKTTGGKLSDSRLAGAVGETDFDFVQRLMQEWGIYWCLSTARTVTR